MSNEVCPHCGAEIRTAGLSKNEYYMCWTSVIYTSDRAGRCYERQIEQQAAEIERLKKTIRELEEEIEDWKHPSKNICI